MTPKEKANELVNKFELCLAGNISNGEDWETVSKECSIACVYEIIELIKQEQPEKFQQELIDYWDKVIVQIESIT